MLSGKTRSQVWGFLLVAVIIVWSCRFAGDPVRAADVPSSPPEAESLSSSEGLSSAADGGCEQVLRELQQDRSRMSWELAQVKREIAALRQELAEPGIEEIFSGIGYILGLAGVGFFVHCRKHSKEKIS